MSGSKRVICAANACRRSSVSLIAFTARSDRLARARWEGWEFDMMVLSIYYVL